MTKTFLLFLFALGALVLNAQSHIIFDGEIVHDGWWPVGSTQYIDVNSNPSSTLVSTFPIDYPISTPMQQVKEMLDQYLAMDVVDKDRVYIVGLSMRGMGTFDLTCRFPEVFAAAVPICGGINVDRLTADVKNIYWRLFHCDIDTDVPVKNSRTAYSKLQTLKADVEYIEEAGVAHNVWNNAFAKEDFLSWLFSKTRKQSASIAEHSSLAEIVSIQLYSISGCLISVLGKDEVLSQSNLAKGIYIIKEKDINGKITASKAIKFN